MESNNTNDLVIKGNMNDKMGKTGKWARMIRWFKYKYLLLFRAKGGATMVASGFSVGLMVEMFTLPTFGLAFFLIFPLVYLFRASMAGALIGFVFGKIIYIPMAFLNSQIGGWIIPDHLSRFLYFLPHWMKHFLYVYLKLIVGGIINGALLGLIVYFPIKWLIELYAKKRKTKRHERKKMASS